MCESSEVRDMVEEGKKESLDKKISFSKLKPYKPFWLARRPIPITTKVLISTDDTQGRI